jgi:hypothetical protein
LAYGSDRALDLLAAGRIKLANLLAPAQPGGQQRLIDWHLCWPDNIGNLKKYRVFRWLKAVLESGPGSQTPLPPAFVDDPDRPPTAYPPGQWREFPVERAQRSGLAAFGVAYDSGRIARRFRSLGTLCDSQHLKHDERRDRACVQHNRGRRFQSFDAVSISDAEIEYLNWPRFVGFRQLAKADCPLV